MVTFEHGMEVNNHSMKGDLENSMEVKCDLENSMEVKMGMIWRVNFKVSCDVA